MQKRLVLVCEDSLCPRKQPDVNKPGLGEAGRYNVIHGGVKPDGRIEISMEFSDTTVL